MSASTLKEHADTQATTGSSTHSARQMRVIRTNPSVASVSAVAPEFFAPRSPSAIPTPPTQHTVETPETPDPQPETLGERVAREKRREAEHRIHTIARVVGQACIEAELGLRSVQQLTRWMNLPTFEKMKRRSLLAQRIRSKDHRTASVTRAISSRVSPITQHTYEASTSVHVGGRVRAAAMRVEWQRGWKVTAIELG